MSMYHFCILLSIVLFFLDFFDSVYFRFYEIIMPVIIYLFWEFAFAFKEGYDESKKSRGE